MTSQEWTNDGFPDKDRPDNEKDAKYVVSVLRRIIGDWQGYATYGAYNGNTPVWNTINIYGAPFWAQELRDFSAGLNTNDKLRKFHQLNDPKANDIQTAMKTDWTPSRFQVKIARKVSQLMYDRDTKFYARPLDPTSVSRSEMERYQRMARTKRLSDPDYQRMAELMGSGEKLQPHEPQTLAELDIYERMGPRDQASMRLTTTVKMLLNASDYPNLCRVAMADEFRDTGICIVVIEVSPAGIPYPRVVKVEDAVLPWSDRDFRNMPWAGYMRYMTITELRAEVGDAWGPRDSEKWKQAKSMMGRGDGRTIPIAGVNGLPMTGVRNMPGRIPVFTGFFKDYNHWVQNERKVRDGKVIYEEGVDGVPPKPRWTQRREEYEVVYKGNYVVGTVDSPSGGSECLHWGCGLALNQQSMTDELHRTEIPMVVEAYGMTNMRNLPIARQILGQMTNIEALIQKLRDLTNKIVPPGVGQFDIDGLIDSMAQLENPGDRTTFIAHAIEMFYANGSIGMSTPADAPDGVPRQRQLLQPHAGFIPKFEEIANQIAIEMNWLQEALGFNDTTMGNTADNKSLVGAMKLQVQATAQSLGYLFKAWDNLERRVALQLYKVFQCTMSQGAVLEGAANLLGEPGESYFRFASQDDPGTIGIEVRMQMTDEQKIDLNTALEAAQALGTIGPMDRAAVMMIDDFRMAMAILDSRIKLNEEKAHQRQMEVAKANQQGALQAEQMRQQGLLDKMDAEMKMLNMKLQGEGKNQLDAIGAKGQIDLQAKMAQIQADQDKVLQTLAAMLDKQEMMIKSQERIAAGSNVTKLQVGRESNETSKEIAEEGAERKTGED